MKLVDGVGESDRERGGVGRIGGGWAWEVDDQGESL